MEDRLNKFNEEFFGPSMKFFDMKFIEVNGEDYNGLMPQHSFLKDFEIAKVLTYIRTNFGNDASPVTVEEVKKYRTSNQKKTEK